MSLCIVIVGLPGSGKTHLAKRWVTQGCQLFDDPRDAKPIMEALDSGHSVVIADPHLCHPSSRDGLARLMQGKPHHLEWKFFENDPDQCWLNVLLRNDGRNISRDGILMMSRGYTIPEGADVIPVYRPGSNP